MIWYELRVTRKRQEEETYHRIFAYVLDVDRFFFDNLEVKPYIYEGAPLPDTFREGSPDFSRLMTVAEIVLDLFVCAYLQFNTMPKSTREGWITFMRDIGASSELIRYYLCRNATWYVPSLVHLLETGIHDPRLDRKGKAGAARPGLRSDEECRQEAHPDRLAHRTDPSSSTQSQGKSSY
jgi:hypothetical protein